MGASVIGILAALLAVAGLIVWGMVSVLGPVTTMVVGFAVVCVLMMLIILIQKPRGGGLSGAFGGAGGGTQAAFGAKTGDVLTLATIVFFVLYMFLAMGLTWATAPDTGAPATTAPVSVPVDTTDADAEPATSATTTTPDAAEDNQADPAAAATKAAEDQPPAAEN